MLIFAIRLSLPINQHSFQSLNLELDYQGSSQVFEFR